MCSVGLASGYQRKETTTFLLLLVFGVSLLVCFFVPTMMMMMLMMIDDPFNREHHREGEEKEATKTLILFSHTNTHTHTLSLFLCFPLKTLSRARRLYYAPRLRVCALLYIISDEICKRKIFSRERERERKRKPKNWTRLGFNTLNKKQSKNLFVTKIIDATRRDRLNRERER